MPTSAAAPCRAETCFLQQAYELGDSLSNWETVFWRADGELINVECTVRPQHQDGECVGVVVAFRDIAERKRHEAETQWQLRHDHLTKLHNRRHFEYMLEQEIFRLRRSTEQSALLFIDLDRFKHINDTAGHAAGDALLASIGRKLKARSRQSDLVARLGGDEFAVLLRNVDDGSVLALAEKFRAILDEERLQPRRARVRGLGQRGHRAPEPPHAVTRLRDELRRRGLPHRQAPGPQPHPHVRPGRRRRRAGRLAADRGRSGSRARSTAATLRCSSSPSSTCAACPPTP